MTTDSPPDHLNDRSAAFWSRMIADYDLEDPPARELLLRACEAMTRLDQARSLLDSEGLTVEDRYGQVKPHPATSVETQSRIAVARLLRELRVLDPPDDPRPPRGGGRR